MGGFVCFKQLILGLVLFQYHFAPVIWSKQFDKPSSPAYAATPLREHQVRVQLAFSQDEVADSERLEPAFESFLRSLKVNDSVIDAMRVNEITDRALFTDLAQDEQELKKCAKAYLKGSRVPAPARDGKAHRCLTSGKGAK